MCVSAVSHGKQDAVRSICESLYVQEVLSGAPRESAPTH